MLLSPITRQGDATEQGRFRRAGAVQLRGCDQGIHTYCDVAAYTHSGNKMLPRVPKAPTAALALVEYESVR